MSKLHAAVLKYGLSYVKLLMSATPNLNERIQREFRLGVFSFQSRREPEIIPRYLGRASFVSYYVLDAPLSKRYDALAGVSFKKHASGIFFEAR